MMLKLRTLNFDCKSEQTNWELEFEYPRSTGDFDLSTHIQLGTSMWIPMFNWGLQFEYPYSTRDFDLSTHVQLGTLMWVPMFN